MAHETKLLSGKITTHHGHVKKGDVSVVYDENEEIEMPEKENNFYDRINQLMEKVATTRTGQMMLEKTEHVLKVVEDTAKWSLPQDDSDIILERPLPWLLFLTLIVWLRVFRICLTIGCLIVGAQPVTAHYIVRYLQMKRHRLRSIRVQGLKLIRNREIETTVMYGLNKNITFFEKLRKFLTSAICKPEQHCELPARCKLTPDAKSTPNLSEQSTKRPHIDHDDDDDDDDDGDDCNDIIIDNSLTINELLDKYANENSDNDSDYIPEEDEEEEDDDDDASSSTSPANSSSAAEDVKNESEALLKTNNNIQEEANNLLRDALFKMQNIGKIQENGQSAYDPLKDGQNNIVHILAGNNIEEIPKIRETNGVGQPQAPQPQSQTNEQAPATTTAAVEGAANTPKTLLTYIEAPQLQENEKKSTPGHESAASLKPSLITTNRAGQTSALKGADHYKSSSTENLETLGTGSQKKYNNHSTHNKHYHHNNKNFNKIRR